MTTLKIPLLVNHLPDRRMGRKAFGKWLNSQLLELLASEVGIGPEQLVIVIRQKKAAEAILNLLDEIIILQAIGFGIQTLLAPLAGMRYLVWEQLLPEGDKLIRRFQHSLNYHWRIIHHLDPPPLPAGMRDYKRELTADLRLVVKRMGQHFRSQHRLPSQKEVLDQFSLVVAELNSNYLNSQATRVSWLTFLAQEPEITKRMISGLLNPTALFYAWLSWSWQLRMDSLRQAISRQ